MPVKKRRSDQQGPHHTLYLKNRKTILASQNVCAICGKPVDSTLKFPDPLSATVDHIIPIAKGGSPDSIDNMQLAHLCCNRSKGDSLPKRHRHKEEIISNRVLPQHYDWSSFGR